MARRVRGDEDVESPVEAPAPKRRRLASSNVILRPPSELRESLELLYARLQGEPDEAAAAAADASLQSEMVVVRTLGARGQRSFRCLRSLLASASRPLAAMLYGSDRLRMRESDACSITLHAVEPSTFELLLHYLHGKGLQLEVNSAVALYSLADYYDITSLREACSDFLEAGVRPNALVWWLALARELQCQRLGARCREMLQAELVAVDATDPRFRALPEEDLVAAIQSSAVVCTGERDVWDIVQRWAAGRPDQAGALERLAQHIRWPLMDTAYLQSLDHARCSRSHAYQVPLIAEALHYQRATPAVRKELLDSLGLRATPRQYLLGELVVFDRTGASSDEPRPIKPGDEYTVGRSRRSDLIFANPFVSSTHCRIYIDEVGEGASRELEVKLKDVSSNGAYVNAELVGRDNVVSLKHGDRISVVRPQGVHGEAAGGGNAMMGYILFRQRRPPARGADASASKAASITPATEAHDVALAPGEDGGVTRDA